MCILFVCTLCCRFSLNSVETVIRNPSYRNDNTLYKPHMFVVKLESQNQSHLLLTRRIYLQSAWLLFISCMQRFLIGSAIASEPSIVSSYKLSIAHNASTKVALQCALCYCLVHMRVCLFSSTSLLPLYCLCMVCVLVHRIFAICSTGYYGKCIKLSA